MRFFKAKETEHEKKMREAREKLDLSSMDEDVREAVKFRTVVEEVTKGCRTDEERTARLRQFVNMRQGNFQAMAKDMNATRQVEILDNMSDDMFKKLEKMAALKKGKKLNFLDYK